MKGPVLGWSKSRGNKQDEWIDLYDIHHYGGSTSPPAATDEPEYQIQRKKRNELDL